MEKEKRPAARAVPGETRHPLDLRPASTNNTSSDSCAIMVNISAQTRLRMDLVAEAEVFTCGDELKAEVVSEIVAGGAGELHAFGRLSAPLHDLGAMVSDNMPENGEADADSEESEENLDPKKAAGRDPALILAGLESADPELAVMRDEEVAVVTHHAGPLHMHVQDTPVPGAYHLGLYVEGLYYPDQTSSVGDHDHGADGHDHAEAAPAAAPGSAAAQRAERFTRVLNVSVGIDRRSTDKR
jgi:hypothetical protein